MCYGWHCPRHLCTIAVLGSGMACLRGKHGSTFTPVSPPCQSLPDLPTLPLTNDETEADKDEAGNGNGLPDDEPNPTPIPIRGL